VAEGGIEDFKFIESLEDYNIIIFLDKLEPMNPQILEPLIRK